MPSTEPIWVIFESSAAFAIPKSASLTTPSGLTIRLPGLTSRWMTPWRCAYSSPSQACETMSTASLDGEPLALAQHVARRCRPSTYSITMKWRRAVLVPAGVVDLHDVGMDQLGGGQRLAPEAGDEAVVLGEVLGQQLDRHLALEHAVERPYTVDMPPAPSRSSSR